MGSVAAVHLVQSLPGLFLRAPVIPVGLSLRLRVVTTRDWLERGQRRYVLRRGKDLKLRSGKANNEDVLGYLHNASAAALRAAEALGFVLQEDVEPLTWHTPQHDAFVGDLCNSYHDWINDGQWIIMVFRAVLHGRCEVGWIDDVNGLAELLASMEINCGLLSLEEHLREHLWLNSDECHYAAITGSWSNLPKKWFEDFDRVTGRAAPDGLPGPSIIAPGGQGPIDSVGSMFAECGRLCRHLPPLHSVGRELVHNHSKIIVRKFCDKATGVPYGWAYMGSHNLTFSAWGSLLESPCGDEGIRMMNRELGVLFIHPRGGLLKDADAFANLPVPFGLPVILEDVAGREVLGDEMWIDEEARNMEGEDAWSRWNDFGWDQWSNYWWGWSTSSSEWNGEENSDSWYCCSSG